MNPLGLSLRASTFTVYAESSERLPTRLNPLAERALSLAGARNAGRGVSVAGRRACHSVLIAI